MKTTNFIRITAITMILLVFALNVNACNTAIYQNKQERKVPDFSELKLAIGANVILTQGTQQKVEILASDKLLNLIETDVNDGKLTIKWTENWINNNEKITVYITMVDIKGLTIAGSGNINAQEKISTTGLNLSISGSGKIELNDLTATDIKATIAGSADIIIGGSSHANSLQARISGSGKIDVPNLSVKNVDISISGSGDCIVNSSESIVAKVSGSGNVYYTGEAIIDAKVSGSGKIKKLN